MRGPRLSLGLSMGIVAILAVDCGLIRLILDAGDEQGAVCAVGFWSSPAYIAIFLARRRQLSRFAAGFVVGSMLAAIALVAIMLPVHDRCGELWNAYYNAMLGWLPRYLADDSKWQPVDSAGVTLRGLTPRGAVVCLVMVAVPMASLAVVGGLGALALRRRGTSNLASDLTPP